MGRAEELRLAADAVAASLDADIFLCNAPMQRGLDSSIIDLFRKRRLRPNVLLILVTSGGDADAAYRIARHLQCAYDKFFCLISGYCKSAGTLLALGAAELIFSPHGEMGPLDVQMAKKDELIESESGLTVMTALSAIREQALAAFEHFFLETTVKAGGRLSVHIASEIGVGLTRGIFGPIAEQIDPIHIGEAWRSLAVAKEYGSRLIRTSKNMLLPSLEYLISNYPSHGFVIDRIEAGTLFEHVRETNVDEQTLVDTLGESGALPGSKDVVQFISTETVDQEANDVNAEQGIGEERQPDDAKLRASSPPSHPGGSAPGLSSVV